PPARSVEAPCVGDRSWQGASAPLRRRSLSARSHGRTGQRSETQLTSSSTGGRGNKPGGAYVVAAPPTPEGGHHGSHETTRLHARHGHGHARVLGRRRATAADPAAGPRPGRSLSPAQGERGRGPRSAG